MVEQRPPDGFVGRRAWRAGARAARRPGAGCRTRPARSARSRASGITRSSGNSSAARSQDARGRVELAGGLLDAQQLEQRPGRVVAPVGAVGRDVEQPHQQRLHAIVAVKRDGQIDRLAHLAERDVGRRPPAARDSRAARRRRPTGGRCARRAAGSSPARRRARPRRRPASPRARRSRLFSIASHRLAMPASRVSARPSSSAGGAIQRLGGGFRACAPPRRPSLSRPATRSHSATSPCCCASRAMPDSTLERPRLHLLGAAMQIERARAIAEVVLGDRPPPAAAACWRRPCRPCGGGARPAPAAARPAARSRPHARASSTSGRCSVQRSRARIRRRAAARRRPPRACPARAGCRPSRRRSPPRRACRRRARGASRTAAPARRGRPSAAAPRCSRDACSGILDRRRQRRVEQLVGLARVSALARQAVEAQQDLRQRQARAGGVRVEAPRPSRVCTSSVR